MILSQVPIAENEDDENCSDSGSIEDGWTFLHEAAKYGNLDIAHFMLTETDIDPNMVSRGWINDESRKTELWTPLQIAWYLGYYKIVAILLADSRTIYNFTTREDSLTPKLISKKMIKMKNIEEESKTTKSSTDSGVNYIKWVELLDDAKHFKLNKVSFK